MVGGLGAAPAIVSLVLSVSSFTVAFACIPGGYLAGRVGRKRLIFPLTFLVGISSFIYAFVPSWQWFLLGIVISRFARLYQPAMRAILADSLPVNQRGLEYSFIRILPSLMGIIGPSLALFLIHLRGGLMPGIRTAYLLSAFAGISIAILRGILLKPTVKGKKHTEKLAEDIKHQYKEVKDFILEKLKPLLILYLTYRFGWGMMVLTQLFIIDLSTPEFWGILYLLRRLVIFIFTVPLGYLSDKIGRKLPLLIGIASLATASFILWSTTKTLIKIFGVIAVILIGISWAVRSTVLRSLEADLVPKQFRGRVSGVLSFISGIVYDTGQFIAGPIYEHDLRLPF